MKKERNEYDVKVTKTLVDAYRAGALRDEIAKKAVKNFLDYGKFLWEKVSEANSSLTRDCRILYSGHERLPVSRPGWIDPISDFSYKLESLNYEYRRYGLSVVMDQMKEKFGEFRGYWHVRYVPWGLAGVASRTLGLILKILDRWHWEFGPFRQRIFDLMCDIEEKCESRPESAVMRRAFEREIYDAVEECVRACRSRCCDCGTEIGSRFEPVCVNQGWILYRCRRCSMADGGRYFDMKAKKYMVEGKAVKAEKPAKGGGRCSSDEI